MLLVVRVRYARYVQTLIEWVGKSRTSAILRTRSLGSICRPTKGRLFLGHFFLHDDATRLCGTETGAVVVDSTTTTNNSNTNTTATLPVVVVTLITLIRIRTFHYRIQRTFVKFHG